MCNTLNVYHVQRVIQLSYLHIQNSHFHIHKVNNKCTLTHHTHTHTQKDRLIHRHTTHAHKNWKWQKRNWYSCFLSELKGSVSQNIPDISFFCAKWKISSWLCIHYQCSSKQQRLQLRSDRKKMHELQETEALFNNTNNKTSTPLPKKEKQQKQNPKKR